MQGKLVGGDLNLKMFPQHQKEKTSLSSGDILKEAGHVMGKPAEHAVLVLVQVLVVHHLLPACLHVHLHLVLGRQLQALLDALRRKKIYLEASTPILITWRILHPITETMMSMWWMRKRGSSTTV